MSWVRIAWGLWLFALVVLFFSIGTVFTNELEDDAGRQWWTEIPVFALPWIGVALYLYATTRQGHPARLIGAALLVVNVAWFTADRLQDAFGSHWWIRAPRSLVIYIALGSLLREWALRGQPRGTSWVARVRRRSDPPAASG